MFDQDDHNQSSRDESIGALLSQLAESGKSYAQAEFNRQKLWAGEIGRAFRNIAMLVAVAAFLVLSASVALLVGLVLGLSPLIGALGATAAVVGAALALAFLLLILARSRFRRLSSEERS